MRLFFLLLILLNIALFAYFNTDVIVPKPVVVNKELNADMVRLLAEKDLIALTKKATNAVSNKLTQADSGCYQWGDFSSNNLSAAQMILVELGLQSDVKKGSIQKQARRFWVYYPPLKTAALAQQKAGEIKALGIDELYIVQDLKWRNAISFGLFTEEAHAIALLKWLKTKGVNNAKKTLRTQEKALASLLVKGVSEGAALQLYKMQPEFVGTRIILLHDALYRDNKMQPEFVGTRIRPAACAT